MRSLIPLLLKKQQIESSDDCTLTGAREEMGEHGLMDGWLYRAVAWAAVDG